MIEEASLRDGVEAHVFGPPGCGKTTYVTGAIERAAKKYGGSSILVDQLHARGRG